MVHRLPERGIAVSPEERAREERQADAEHRHGMVRALVNERWKRGLTQWQVAERMNIDVEDVRALESGDHDMRLSELRRYSRALGIRLANEIEAVEDFEKPGTYEPGLTS